MTLSEVDIACVNLRRCFINPIPSPVSVSITTSSSTLSPFHRPTVTTLKAIQSSWLTSFIPVPGLSWSPNRTPKSLRLPHNFPFSQPLSQVQQLPRWDYILYVHCSFIDNVILADCNRLQLPFPPNLIALQWAAQTVHVCPDFTPITMYLIMSYLDQFE